MKKKPADEPTAAPVTSLRIEPDLAFRARQLALRNKRDGLPAKSFTAVVNLALGEYLGKKRGA